MTSLSTTKFDGLPDGLWADDACIMATEMANLRNNDPALRKVKYLGGVAFKHTPDAHRKPRGGGDAGPRARILRGCRHDERCQQRPGAAD